MIDHRASQRYARALFGLSEKAGALEKVENGLEEVLGLVRKHPEITRLVSNSTVSFSEKEDFLDKIIPSSVPRVVLEFLKVIAKKKRFREFEAMRFDFRKLYEKKRGIREVTAISAIPLSKRVEDKLVRVLKARLNADIRLLKETNPKLIGGLILRFEDTEIDASYKTRILELKQMLKR